MSNGVHTQLAIPIAAKFSSLKSLLMTFRNTAQIGANGYFPFSSVRMGLIDYQFRIGSSVMPAKAPNTYIFTIKDEKPKAFPGLAVP